MYKTHIIVDFEMNPVSKRNKKIRQLLRNEIIEIGAVMLNEKHKVTDKFVCYVCPQYNEKVTNFITNLTGIKTTDVYKADSFEIAVEKFSEWIGKKEDTRIYSWSNADLKQLREECFLKEVEFPTNMHRWLDLQAVYSRVTGLSKVHEKIALKTAAEQFGIEVDKNKIHNALYDAEITSEILIPILNGNYCEQVKLLQETKRQEVKPMTQTMGEVCGMVFEQFLKQIQQESENER